MLIPGLLIFLAFATLAAYFLKRSHLRRAYAWLLLAIPFFIVWVLLLTLSEGTIRPWLVQDWFRAENFRLTLKLSINPENWPFLLMFIAAHIAQLLTSFARGRLRQKIFALLVASAQIIPLYIILTSAELVSLILAWTFSDAFWLGYQIFIRKAKNLQVVYSSMVIKLCGLFVLMFSAARISAGGQSLYLDSLPAEHSIPLFMAALLHCGILPIQIESGKQNEADLQDFSAGFSPFISSLVLITYLPTGSFPFFGKLGLQALSFFITMYFLSRLLKARTERIAVQEFLFAFTGFVSFSYLIDMQSKLIGWFVLMIGSLTWLKLFSHRGRPLRFFLLLMILFLSGLPFTLMSYGSQNLIETGFRFSAILGILAHAVFLAAFLRFVSLDKENFDDLDSSIQAAYLVGLFVLIISLAAVTIRRMGSVLDEVFLWWIGPSVLLITAGFYFWQKKKDTTTSQDDGGGIHRFYSLDWLNTPVSILTNQLRSIISGFTLLLEGKGGVLWSIVLLALLITLIRTR